VSAAATISIEPIELGYLGLAGAASAWLVRSRGGRRRHAALVECGPMACLSRLERGLAEAGVSLAEIEAVLVTHVHLDHAGAAGRFAAAGTPVAVHPRGAKHLADPSRLEASARAVHGALFDRFHGAPVPCGAERLVAVPDGGLFEVGPLRFTAIETPGHARHHHAWSILGAEGLEIFTGDVAAMRLPQSGSISLPTPPTAFEPQAWDRSLARLGSLQPRRLRLTHGGTVEEPAAWIAAVRGRLAEEARRLRELAADSDRDAALRRYRRWLRERAAEGGASSETIAAFITAGFAEMNLAGARGLLAHEAGGEPA
jgi:glyoxylase-like metal-dependent hydrolase (beta-lactamase superfamily II)